MKLGLSPFADTVPWVLAALAHALAVLIWTSAGAALPGGRWLAVHLFTIGVLTNLVLGFTAHFAATVTRQPQPQRHWRVVVANTGALLVLTALPTGQESLLALGATLLTAVVLRSYQDLRRMRRAAVGARFAWVVRVYERAHGAFVHGALLGILMGVGVLPGTWYLAARTAHLHVNVLGWGGLTLLATLVFFGPTMARTRIVEGADGRAAGALRHGATGLTAGTVALLLTGLDGTWGIALRLTAAAAFAVYAGAATTVCVPVVRAALRADPSAVRWSVVAVRIWLPVAVWADVVLIAAGAWRHLDVVGSAVLLGVLLQAVLSTLSYLAPMLRGRSRAARDRIIARFEQLSATRTVALNAGVVAVVAAGLLGGTSGAVLGRAGWVAVIAVVVAVAAAAAAPIRGSADVGETASQEARHRGGKGQQVPPERDLGPSPAIPRSAQRRTSSTGTANGRPAP